VDPRPHLVFAGGALKRWFIATCYDALAVAALWLVGLLILRVPLPFFWAFLGGAFQFVPNIGPILSLIGPSLSLLFAGADGMRFLYLLILYVIIVVIDALLLQPYLMKRQNKVPIWASILAPLVLGFLIPFWGVLLAPPLLAVLYAFRARNQAALKADLTPSTETQRRREIQIKN
jgi:predicted PurR-regulated permease PerM